MSLLSTSTCYRALILISSLTLSTLSLATEYPTIEVITRDAYPIKGMQTLQRRGFSVKVYNLDDSQRLISKIGINLPNHLNAAKSALQQRFNKIGLSAVSQQFMTAFQATSVSTQYGLTRYPAVVFDHGQSVIYGVTDLHQAVNLYQQWQEK